MASRAAKVTFWIVGSVLGVIVLAVLAVVAWIFFRPVNAGDYRSVRSDIDIIVDLNSFPLEGMVASVGSPTGAQAAENLDNRIINTLGQIDILRESVDQALDSTAAKKDEDLRALIEKLDASYDDLSTTFQTWSENGYSAIGAAATACAPTNQHDDATCTSALSDAESASPPEALAQLRDAAQTVADSGDPADLAAALEAVSSETAALWEPIPATVSEIDAYLEEHG